MARDAHGLATLGVAGVYLSRRGNKFSGLDGRLAATAHAHGIRAELLLSNDSDRLRQTSTHGRPRGSLAQGSRANAGAGRRRPIAVMASTDPQEYVARGYRLAELGQAVDTLALMTYDQHGPWSGPGRSARVAGSSERLRS